MFKRTSEPLPLSEASLLSLRPALNAPVLNVGFLPVGPARAAIVAFGEEWGGIGLALGIRSTQGGQVAVFRNQVPLEPDVAIAGAMEPVLAEAERMGFLFDEDMVANSSSPGEARARALALWGRLMGDVEMPPPPRVAPAEPAAREPIVDRPDRPAPVTSPPSDSTSADWEVEPSSDGLTLMLEDVAEVDLLEISLSLEDELTVPDPDSEKDLGPVGATTATAGGPSAAAPAPTSAPAAAAKSTPTSAPAAAAKSAPTSAPAAAAKSTPTSAPAAATAPKPEADGATEAGRRVAKPRLSKFRHAEADAENGTNEDGAGRLGRIPIVKVRRGREGGARMPYLARLLSSF